ncbi:hypothetical protein [Tepidimonas charontis]|uniref:Uncharacterized protein n=1 Tax=Tepidimonas charontis TaxID=2267262 RepID=A0A554XGT9_9BURK|nr:hypothetical protein [Tepidimonas charontis]TSE35043.1 hypothetical protein Tchar_00974 [Tepidimonas charontis]
MNAFLHTLRTQRWDDHRYYHHSRINQTLHLISAISFLVAYVWLWIDPAVAALIGWGISMVTRQSGHFFFEPKGYDHVNQATHEYKEAIKVGYNLRRKTVLMALWAAIPVLLWWDPDFFGWLQPHSDNWGFWRNVGWLWLWLAIGGLLFRVVQLWWTHNALTALAWATKILTDPFHDIKLYHRAPLHLWRGQRLDGEQRAG